MGLMFHRAKKERTPLRALEALATATGAGHAKLAGRPLLQPFPVLGQFERRVL